MKILVAGGCGYIGSVLVPMLIERGHDVTVLDRQYLGRNLPASVEVIHGDTRAATESLFYRVERVIDLAGLSNDPACDLDRDLTVENNFRGAVHLASTAYRAGVASYVYVSSCAIYGDSGETMLANPLTEYARAKHAVEHAVERIWSRGTCAIPRPATVYGLSPRMRFDLAPNMMSLRAARGQPIEVWGEGTQWRPFVHVRDVARFLCDTPGTDLVGSNEQTMQASTLAERIAAVSGGTVVYRRDMPTDTRSYRPFFLRNGIASVSLEDGVREIVDAVREGRITDGPFSYTVQRYKQLRAEHQL